jgi:RsiW-degrading membrane proteinase PrsW (M82 family)
MKSDRTGRNMAKNKNESFLKGVVKDLQSMGLILVVVFFLSILLGVSLLLLIKVGEGLALVGSIIFIILTPIFLLVGVYFGRGLHQRSRKDAGRIMRMFKEKRIHPGKYTKKYRNRFIKQRFVSLIIMISVFFISTFILGLLWLIPDLSCICIPISLPFLLIAITTPAVGWVMFTYAFDPYEPEPRAMIILGLTWGMLSTFPSLFLNSFNATWMDPLGIEVAIVSAPIFEEFFKAIGFVLVFSFIKDETDGVIYGATFGAGFALLENLFYSTNSILDGGGSIVVLLVLFRSFVNIVGHMIGPALIGFLIGFAKCQYRDRGKERSTYFITLISYITIAYIIGMIIHAGWNFFVGQESLLVLFIFPYIFFQLILFTSMVIGSFFLATMRYKKRLRKKIW